MTQTSNYPQKMSSGYKSEMTQIEHTQDFT